VCTAAVPSGKRINPDQAQEEAGSDDKDRITSGNQGQSTLGHGFYV